MVASKTPSRAYSIFCAFVRGASGLNIDRTRPGSLAGPSQRSSGAAHGDSSERLTSSTIDVDRETFIGARENGGSTIDLDENEHLLVTRWG